MVISGKSGDDAKPLAEAIAADRRADGTRVWTPVVAASLLVWFVLAMQCVSTTAVVRRETGGWGFALLQIVYMNGLAWISSFAVYQIGSHFWPGAA